MNHTKAIFSLIGIALVGIVGYLVVRGLMTGDLAINNRLVNRSRNPIFYWVGIVLGFVLLFIWGTGLVRLIRGMCN